MRAVVRFICLWTVRLFYRQIKVTGADRVPEDGPVVVVSNHPNGLMDPMVLRMALERDVGFLAKSTLFGNPLGRLAMEAFSAVPVYRSKDGADTSKNRNAFQASFDRLADGEWIVVFPEGVSHSEPKLRPLKTGAARIALGAEADNDFTLGLKVLPVGLLYEAKETFRTRVAASIGEAIPVDRWREAYAEDERGASREMTEALGEAMGEVVLEAESDELWRGFLAVARWTDPAAAEDMAVCETRARELAAAYRKLMSTDPERAEEILEETQAFVRMVEEVGVEDPLRLDDEPPPVGRIVGAGLSLLAIAPLALIGILTSWPVYRAIEPLAVKVAGGETDIVSTIKALAGLVFMPLLFLAEAAVATWVGGWGWGLLFLAVIPVCGYVAIRFVERLRLRRRALRAFWLRLTRADVVQEIAQRRAELSTDIDRTLAQITS